MAEQKWTRIESGIRTRQHPTRKHGVKPDQYFVLRFTVGERKIQEALGWSSQGWTLAKAREVLHELKQAAKTGEGPVTLAQKREIARAKREAEAQRLTIGGLWDVYLRAHQDRANTATDKSNIKHLAGLLDRHPESLRTADVDELRRGLEAQGKAPQTVKHVMGLLRRILRYSEQRGLCTMPSRGQLFFEMPKVDNQKTECLSPEQIKALLEALDADRDQDLAALVRLALLTGMRRGALFGLEWRDLDFRNGTISLRGAVAKGGRTTNIPMTDDARNVLLSVPRLAGSPLVFPSPAGGKRVNIQKFADRVRKRAGLPEGFRLLHGLRHTYASLLASSGVVDMYTLQRLMTHESAAMTQRYAHLADEAKRKAAEVASEIVRQAVNGEPQSTTETSNVIPFGDKKPRKTAK